MKKTSLFGIACVVFAGGFASAGNYVLAIDGKKHEVEVGKQKNVELSDGKTIKVVLEKKAIVSFKAENLSFEHPSGVAPSRTEIRDGIQQTMMATPLGTLVLVQEYAKIDPAGLVDMMISQLTKEEKQRGYKITNSPAKTKLASGKTLTGRKSISTHKGEQTTRHVLCYSISDAGVMIITQIDNEAPPEDRSMVDVFWKTLNISLK